MIRVKVPVSIRDRHVQMEFDDGIISLKIGTKTEFWFIRPPRERGPIERNQMRLEGMMHCGVYASMVHTSTVSHKRHDLSEF